MFSFSRKKSANLAFSSKKVATQTNRALSTYALTNRLKDQVAIVTGASAGIGAATVRAMIRNGAAGIVCADINEKALRETAAEAEKLARELNSPTKISVFPCDVSKDQQVAALVKHAEDHYGKLTVMFNNAGIMDTSDDDAVNTSDQVWDRTFNINVKGVWYGCRHAIPAMRRAGQGSIINTSSFVAHMGAATCQLAYTASKGSVGAITRELAAVHARENIRVNNLCPGPLRTKLLMDFLDSEEKKQRRLVHIPMGRFGEATEMAETVVFLASPEASYITGHDMLVDGGITKTYVTPQG